MKHVIFYQELIPVKEIDCELVDITERSVSFHGIVSKKNPRVRYSAEHFGKVHSEVNVMEKQCFLDFGNDRTAVITW